MRTFSTIFAPILALLLVAPLAAPVNGSAQSVPQEGMSTRNEALGVPADAFTPGPLTSRTGPLEIGPGAEVGRLETRNGPVQVGEDATVGPVTTRNGTVQVGARSWVNGDLRSRNGAIRVGEGAGVSGEVRTRNGGIVLGAGGRIQGDVTTRNGTVELEPGAWIQGRLEGRNGPIHLRDARVGHDLDTQGSDVSLLGRSEVEGDLIILRPPRRSFLGFSLGNDSTPVLRISSEARVGGRLILDERVRLEVEDGAEIPEVERYSSRADWGGQ